MKWTDEQQKVIDTRNKNILVSAAAGSGKTAVLVERIITMITDEANPVSISNLLVVTFTNAAAAQMKERIIAAIEKKLLENPNNEFLKKQLILTNTAMITTIDSFLRYIFKNYFNKIDVSPSLRIADESELLLIKNDAMERTIERYFNEKGESFARLVNMYSSAKNYDDFIDIVNKIYNMAVSQPYSKQWISNLSESYMDGSWEEAVVEDIHQKVRSAKEELLALENYMFGSDESFRDMCQPYMDNIIADKDIMDGALACATLEQLEKYYDCKKLSRLKRNNLLDDESKEEIKVARNRYKKCYDDIKKQYFSTSLSQEREIIQKLSEYITLLTEFVRDFYDEYSGMKLQKQLMDFSDLSKYALDILIDKDTMEPTDVAKQLSDYYYEIMIDEYQDSNNIQELILTSISKERQGINNIFMVGDVKQSIYRFRMARPELFIDKYTTYTAGGEAKERIDLHTNFRSRNHVLTFANRIFEKLMRKSIGGVEYDEAAALKCGAAFKDTEDTFAINEVIVYDKEDLDEDIDSAIEFEARLIAAKIKEIIRDKKLVKDSLNGEEILRPVEFGDIVILTRKEKGINEIFIDVFEEENIPCEVNSTVGYFSSVEIKLILNILRIIDNPYQDVALTGVMLSPVFAFTEEEMIELRTRYKDVCIYDGVLCAKACENDDTGNNPVKNDDIGNNATKNKAKELSKGVRDKCKKLCDFIEEYREISKYMKTEDVISKIIYETDIYDYAYAMANGDKRRQNIDALINKAATLDYSGLSGLFKFVATIEKMEKFELEFEPPATVGSENSVKLMTIHKSKGLEFPVVFLAGTYLNYNQMDAKAKLCLDNDMGIGSIYVDYDNRIKYDNIMARAIKNKITKDNVGEELRILYVALTRAKEKLYIVGGGNKLVSSIVDYYSASKINKNVGDIDVLTATSNMKMILRALSGERVFERFVEKFENTMEDDECVVVDKENNISLTLVRNLKGYTKEDNEIVKEKLATTDIERFDTERTYCEDTKKVLEDINNYVYAYEEETKCKGKVSVSDLKLAHIKEDNDKVEDTEEKFVFETDIRKSYIPKFMAGEEETKITGAARGTVYHMVMKELDFLGDLSYEGIVRQMGEMSHIGYIPENFMEIVSVKKIMEFFKTKEGQDMIEADRQGKLYKEKQFVMGLPLTEVYDVDSDEVTIIQGIIDAYYEVDGKIYLLDYKTDSISLEDGEEVLRDRYKLQLDYYKKAIEGGTSKLVEKSIIYSFSMGRAFEV